MKVISFVNMKGGVAKTTLAVNIADCLAKRHEARVLVIDIDPQFNATQCLVSGEDYVQGMNKGQHTILDIFDDAPRPVVSSIAGTQLREPVNIKDIKPWQLDENLHLLPGNLELHRLEMGAGQGRENRLKRYIDHLRGMKSYDYVIIDTPPTPSAWMASALIASDFYLVPVKPEPLSATGIDLLRSVVSKIKENHDLKIECLGVVLTIAESNTIVFQSAIDFIDDNKFWKGKRFQYTLPKRTEVARMQGQQGMILEASNSALRLSIVSITKEFLERVKANV